MKDEVWIWHHRRLERAGICQVGAELVHASGKTLTREEAREIILALPDELEMFCPECGLQHEDRLEADGTDWSRRPHRTHLCYGCGHLWRPREDHPTVGVLLR